MAATSRNHIYVWFVETEALINSFYEQVIDTFHCDYEPCILDLIISEIMWANDSKHLVFLSIDQSGPSYYGYTFNAWHVSSNRIVVLGSIGSFVQFEWSPNKDVIFTRSSAGNGYPRSEAINTTSWGEPTGGDIGEMWAFNPKDNTVLTARHSKNKILLHDLNDLANIREFDSEAHRPRALAWHYNGQLFASAHADEVQVWDAVSVKRIARQLEYMSRASSVLAWEKDYIAYYSGSWGLLHSHKSVNIRRIYPNGEPPYHVEIEDYTPIYGGINVAPDEGDELDEPTRHLVDNPLTGDIFEIIRHDDGQTIFIYDASGNLQQELTNTRFTHAKWRPNAPPTYP